MLAVYALNMLERSPSMHTDMHASCMHTHMHASCIRLICIPHMPYMPSEYYMTTYDVYYMTAYEAYYLTTNAVHDTQTWR